MENELLALEEKLTHRTAEQISELRRRQEERVQINFKHCPVNQLKESEQRIRENIAGLQSKLETKRDEVEKSDKCDTSKPLSPYDMSSDVVWLIEDLFAECVRLYSLQKIINKKGGHHA